MTGRMPDEGINPVEFPESIQHVWGWFLTLNHKRPPAMAGVSPIPESEIGWFFRNRCICPDGWELDALAALDMVARDSVSKN